MKKSKKIFLVVLTLMMVLLPSLVLAQYRTTLENPLGDVPSIPEFIGRIIGYALSAFGAIALLVFVWGGFTWMTSMGNETKVKKGRDTLLWGAIGVAVVFSSYAIIRMIFSLVSAE